MAIDPNPPRTRRELLIGAAAAAAALAAQALARPEAVRAEGEGIVVGGEYTTATSRTFLRNQANGEDVFVSESGGAGAAVVGASAGSFGVRGVSTSSIGVYGSSPSGIGIRGESDTSIGMSGSSSSSAQPAVLGFAEGSSTAVLGHSGSEGAYPGARPKTGVFGHAAQDASSTGVVGESPSGRGGRFKGKKAQIRLMPSTAATHPSSGKRGDLFVDTSGRLWFCRGTTHWVRLA